MNAQRSELTLTHAAWYYERKLQTQAGEVELKIPKLRKLPFETAIIERYRRREASVEEALIEMYCIWQAYRFAESRILLKLCGALEFQLEP